MTDSTVPCLHKLRLERWSLRQHGLITTVQATEIGFHDHYLARSPEWTQIRPRLYRRSAHPPGWRQRLMAAVLVGGPDTVVSHRAAALLHGLDGVQGEIVEITVGPRGQTRNLAGVVVHRSAQIDPTDKTRRDGIPVTSVTRTLIDLGAVVEQETVESALECALRHRWTSINLIRRRLDARGNRSRRGSLLLRRVVARRLYSPPTESELETRFVRLCRRAQIPLGDRQVEVADSTRTDFVWVAGHVLVELDGFANHGTPADHRRDMRRQNALVMARPGWTLLRYGWDDIVNQPERVAAELRRALSSKGLSASGA